MNETIHFISDIAYIKDVYHLKKHIKYVTRPNAKPLHTYWGDKMNVWMERAKTEKAKRYDATLAMKFVLALPNDRMNDKAFYNKVGVFLSEFFRVPTEHIDLAIHRDNPENLHVHVLIYPRGEDGKKLRLKKNDLSNFHRAWDRFLEAEGYKIVKDPEDQRLEHLGWKLYRDTEIRMSYDNYKANKRKIKEYNNMYERIEKEEKHIENEIAQLTIEENMLLTQYYTVVAEQQKKRKQKYIEQRIKQLQDSVKRIEELQKILKDIEYIRLMHFLINDTKTSLDKMKFPEILIQDRKQQPVKEIEAKEIKETSITLQREKLSKMMSDFTSKLSSIVQDKINQTKSNIEQNQEPKYNLTEQKKDTNTNIVKDKMNQVKSKIEQETINPRYDLLEYYYLLKQAGKKNRDFVIECIDINTPLEDIAVVLAYVYKTNFDEALKYVKRVVYSKKDINHIENIDNKPYDRWMPDI